MNITVPPELEALVREKVSSGEFHSPSEVVREGLRLLKNLDDLRTRQDDTVRREIASGLEQLAAGRSVEFTEAVRDDIKARGRRTLARRQGKRRGA